MIRSPKGDRIISQYICSVQPFKGKPASYIFVAGMSVGWLSASYIPPQRLFVSYIPVVTTADAGGLFISYIPDTELLIGGLSVSYIPQLPACISIACTPLSQPDIQLSAFIFATLFFAFGTTFQTDFGEFDELKSDRASTGADESEPIREDGGVDTVTDSNNEPEKRGVIYARVSSDVQAKEGHSLETQVAELRPIAEERGITPICEPIMDEGLTGTDFKREGIRQVFHLASNGQITHLLTQDVDRLGRSTPETLYFIHILQEECNVEIITPTGELDVTEVQGLIETTMKTLMSHVAVMGRSRKANNTVVHRFTKQKQWLSWFQLVPFGYRETEDGWIEPVPEKVEVVQDIFAHFLESESYTGTRRYINEQYGEELDNHFARSQIKRLLKRQVYVGKPTISVSNIKEDKDEICVEDSDLQLVDEETYERVETVIDRIAAKHSTDEDAVDVDTLVDEFGLFPVIESSPVVEVVCPDCKEIMVKNGQRDLNGKFKRHNYLCNLCGQQWTFPKLSELEAFKQFDNQ